MVAADPKGFPPLAQGWSLSIRSEESRRATPVAERRHAPPKAARRVL